MQYLSVVKDEGGEWVIKKTFPNGTNVYGNKTGTLWHRASQMSLEERIEEGIFEQVNTTSGFDADFSSFVRSDIVFDEVNAEVVYTDVYELIPLQQIKDTLKARTHNRRINDLNRTVIFEEEKLTLDSNLLSMLNGYSSLVALTGTLPEGFVLPTKHGVSVPLTKELLTRVQEFICNYSNDVVKRFVQVCADIEAASTYEDVRAAAVWNGERI